jgi:hypothetical protein
VKALLVVPDGTGVRNFVLGTFLPDLAGRMAVDALHPIPEELLQPIRCRSNGSVTWHPLRRYSGTRPVTLLRKSLAYAHMYWADTQSMRNKCRRPLSGGSWRVRTAERLGRVIGRMASSPAGIRLLEAAHLRMAERLPEVEAHREFLRQVKPSVIVSTNQRSLDVLPLVLAGRSLNIPSAAFIFSWDNLTSKGRITAPFDHYLVWSEHMRRELLRYYPGIPAERVHIVGTPQFAPYADDNLRLSRREFFAGFGADPERPLICYSGGDAGTCPEDPQHVRVLLDLVRSGRIQGRPQVMVRPTPVDDGARYEAVRTAYPELLYARPAWVHRGNGDSDSPLPLPEDVGFLANLTLHADLNVNVASTMTLDFALRDRPVVNIAFDVADPPPFGRPLWAYYYRFEHYRPVVEFGAARFARSSAELADHVNAYLGNPQLDREGRRRLVDLEVGVPLGGAIRRLVDVVDGIGRSAQ